MLQDKLMSVTEGMGVKCVWLGLGSSVTRSNIAVVRYMGAVGMAYHLVCLLFKEE